MRTAYACSSQTKIVLMTSKFPIRSVVRELIALTACLAVQFASGQSRAAKRGEIDVQKTGVKADSATDLSPQLQRLIDSHPSGAFYFPPGDYRLHNRGVNRPGLTLHKFSGSLVMATGARFICDTEDTSAGQCIWIKESKGAVFRNITIAYTNPQLLPMKRIAATGNALLVEQSSRLKFLDTTIVGSTGSGIWNTNSTDLTFDGITRITNTTADGIHFENVGSSTVEDLIAEDTGDDGIGLTNIAVTNPNCGLKVERARISNSHSRGIAVAGGCNAEFSNVEIDATANSAIAAVDDAAIRSRRSQHIRFTDVSATRVGTVTSSVSGNKYCVDVGKADDVSILRLTCSDSREDGVFVYDGANQVAIENVVLQHAGNNGFQTSNARNVSFLDDTIIASTNSGFDIESSSQITLRNCKTESAGGYGFYHSRSSGVTESGLFAKNSATKTGNHRAWWAEGMSGPIVVNGLSVIDDQPRATGYIVGDDVLPGNQIVVNGIVFQITAGKGRIESHHPGAHYSMSGHPGLQK